MQKLCKKGYAALAFVLGLWPGLSLAQDVNVENEEDVAEILGNIFNFFYSIFFAFAALSFLYGAYLFLRAGGDPDKVSTAQKVLLYSVIAIAIALLALGMDNVIADIVTG